MKKAITLLSVILSILLCTAFFAACGEKEPPIDDALAPVFTLDKTSVELTTDGNLESLMLTIANIDEVPVWKSSNPEVATVTEGTSANRASVRGVSEGTAVITATAGENIAVCAVTVRQGNYLNLLTEQLELLAGRTESIRYETNITTPISFTSDNPSVATVNSEGLVTGNSGGTARITVSGGNKSAVCTVIVTAPYVTLNEDEILLTVAGGPGSYQLTAQSNGEVEWNSSDSSIATVDDNGLVTAVSEGTAFVTARYASAVATCLVIVKGEIFTLTLSETEHRLELGETFQLYAEFEPEQEDARIEWKVISGEEIISVDGEGNVTSLGIYGTAVVRATSMKDPDVYAECFVSVPEPYSDWLKITDRASLEAALKAGNENTNMYLAANIDLDGATISSSLGDYRGTFDGRGYEISNFTSGRLFGSGNGLGLLAEGVVKNLSIVCTFVESGSNIGLFGMELNGTVENCKLDVTFAAAREQGVFGRNSRGTVKNTIILVRNPQNTAQIYAGTVQGGGTWENVYYAVLEGTVGANGPTLKDLKDASLYEGWDEEVWLIEDGAIPSLKHE